MKRLKSILHWAVILLGVGGAIYLMCTGGFSRALVLVLLGASVGIVVYACLLFYRALLGDGSW
tara:strand:+ start:404 stop:592 length:189 start_codon:yes stop_codon:yes gene_type:complete